MRTIQVTCTETDKIVNADVLTESNMSITAAIDGTTTKVVLKKKNMKDRVFVGTLFGMEFTTRG